VPAWRASNTASSPLALSFMSESIKASAVAIALMRAALSAADAAAWARQTAPILQKPAHYAFGLTHLFLRLHHLHGTFIRVNIGSARPVAKPSGRSPSRWPRVMVSRLARCASTCGCSVWSCPRAEASASRGHLSGRTRVRRSCGRQADRMALADQPRGDDVGRGDRIDQLVSSALGNRDVVQTS